LTHVYFLYREYGYDSKNNRPTTALKSWAFNYYPPGLSGSDINACNYFTISTGTIEVDVTKGFVTSTTTTLLKKFSGWSGSEFQYLAADMYGQCPVNDVTPFSNGTNSQGPTNCIYPATTYQPFKITITGNKIKTTFAVVYDNGVALLSLIGGAVTMIMSVLGGFAAFYNKKFYRQEILDEIRANIHGGKLKDMEYEDLDQVQKSVFLHFLDKNREKRAATNINKLRVRNSHSDKLLLEEIELAGGMKLEDEHAELLDAKDNLNNSHLNKQIESRRTNSYKVEQKDDNEPPNQIKDTENSELRASKQASPEVVVIKKSEK